MKTMLGAPDGGAAWAAVPEKDGRRRNKPIPPTAIAVAAARPLPSGLASRGKEGSAKRSTHGHPTASGKSERMNANKKSLAGTSTSVLKSNRFRPISK